MEDSFFIPALCFIIGTAGCVGTYLASFLMLSEVNQSRPRNEQVAWWDHSFLLKIWKPHRVMSPDSPLRKCVVVLGLLTIAGWYAAFITLHAAWAANAR